MLTLVIIYYKQHHLIFHSVPVTERQIIPNLLSPKRWGDVQNNMEKSAVKYKTTTDYTCSNFRISESTIFMLYIFLAYSLLIGFMLFFVCFLFLSSPSLFSFRRFSTFDIVSLVTSSVLQPKYLKGPLPGVLSLSLKAQKEKSMNENTMSYKLI